MPLVSTFPEVSRRLLPSDGGWHLASSWLSAAGYMADAAVAATSTNALRSVFTARWASELPDGRRQPHPFEYWYAIGGGVGMLLHLGWCLSLVPEPGRFAAELRGDATNPAASRDRFDAAAAELRAAALIMSLGGDITWVDRTQEPRPDFNARFVDEFVGCEVKQLNDGEQDTAFARVDGSFWEAFDTAVQETQRRLGVQIGARVQIRPPIERLEACAQAKPPAVEDARAMGRDAGTAVGELLAQRPLPGDYRLDAHLHVSVLGSRASDAALEVESTSLQPTTGLYVKRVLRSIRAASQQLAGGGGGRLVILERRWPMSWPPGVVEGLRPLGELPDVGAVLLREEAAVASASRTAEAITVVPGPKWCGLSSRFRNALPAECAACGRRHAVLDLLGWMPGRPTPWVSGAPVDESANDAIAAARRTPPARKLAQAIQQMGVAYELERARLLARHPKATPTELAAAFRAWQLRDV